MTTINIDKIITLLREYGRNAEADALESGDAMLNAACQAVNFQEKPTTALARKEDCGCKGTPLSSSSTAMAMRGVDGTVPMWNLPGAAPNCYNRCTPVDECLVPLLAQARSRFDDHAWMYLWIKDPQVLHFNKVVSAASAPFLNALPLTSNAKIIFTQQDSQQLPFLPGYFKLDWKFSVTDAKENVKVSIFTGPRGLTGLTDTSALTPVGDALVLADFECRDDCYFLPYPDLIGCTPGGIPDTRAIYILLEAGGLGGGGNQLNMLNLSMLKRGSKRYASECSQFKLEMY